MSANLDLIRSTYEGSSEDNGRNLLAALAPDAEWTEAEGFPYSGTYRSGNWFIAIGNWDGLRVCRRECPKFG